MLRAEPEFDPRRVRVALVIALAFAVVAAIGVASRVERRRGERDIDVTFEPLTQLAAGFPGGSPAGGARAWDNAYRAALAAATWVAMAEVGDAALRLADATITRSPHQANARRAYLIALFRARSQDSLDGVLRAAEGFEALGDRQVVEQCLQIAEQMAARPQDADARARLRAFSARLSDSSNTVRSPWVLP